MAEIAFFILAKFLKLSGNTDLISFFVLALYRKILRIPHATLNSSISRETRIWFLLAMFLPIRRFWQKKNFVTFFLFHIAQWGITTKNCPENENFQIFIRFLELSYFCLYAYQVSSKSKKKNFSDISGPLCDLNFFSAIVSGFH